MILAVTWHIDGTIGLLVREDAQELVNRGYEVVILYPWHSDERFRSDGIVYHSVAITIKSNTNIVTSVLSAMGAFSRAFSSIIHESCEHPKIDLILSYEWTGTILGFLIKCYLKKPMVSSVFSVESMRASEMNLLSLSIRGLESQSLYRSDLVLARTNEAFLRLLREYKLPSNKVKVAASPKEVPTAVEEVLNRK
ncbi:MAG: glycosyltransferase [Candidatus Nezhaarchaeales archaeon]